MNNRKSLANPLVEKLRSPSGSLRRRSSIAVKTSAVELVDNDDEAERAKLRLKSKNVGIPSPTSSTTSSRRHSLSICSVITSMSSPQIVEGIAECIKLNTQNKINVKNAFNLNMIDFMSYLVRNRNEGMSNLQVAGTSLDISAKIYALRVDGLHQDILKMAGNLDHKEKNSDGDNNAMENVDDENTANDNASENNERMKKKKKKKKSSKKLRTTIEALQGDVDTVCLTPVMFGEADCQTTDMLYQAILPQHCGIGLGLHPYKDVILDDNSKNMEINTGAEPRIAWPAVEFDANRDIITMFPSFEFLKWPDENECNDTRSQSQEIPSLINDDLAFDLDASLPSDEPPTFTGRNFFDVNDDHEDNAEGYHAETRTVEAIVNLPNIIARLPDKKLDYSFFSDIINVCQMGPAHWKIKGVVKHLGASKIMEACGQGAKRKKKEIDLVFNDTVGNCDAALSVTKKNSSKLQAKTVRVVWSEKKLELPHEIHDNALKKICQFFLRTGDIINFKSNVDANDTVLSDEPAYDYENENDCTNYCPNDDNEDAQPDYDTAPDCANSINAASGGFVGDNLIEIPRLTQKILTNFPQRAKKLDVRRLKKCIWNSLTLQNDNNKDMDDANDIEKTHGTSVIEDETKFSDVVVGLPNKMSNNNAEELSFAMAFVSLLHLANEKCLKIVPEDNWSDVTVSKDKS